MKRASVAAAIACSTVLAISAAGSAAAEPFAFPFHDCVGPSGTPASFTAQKQELPPDDVTVFANSTAYRLTDGSAVFIALRRGDIHYPPGTDLSAARTTTCLVDTPLRGTVQVWGFLTPTH